MGKNIHFGDVNEGHDRRKRRKSRRLMLEDFESVMHLRQQDAAKELDVCLSSFKRCFASLNLKWPTPKQRKFLRHHRDIQCRLWEICNSLGRYTDNLQPDSYFEFSDMSQVSQDLPTDKSPSTESDSYHSRDSGSDKVDGSNRTVMNNKMRSLYVQPSSKRLNEVENEQFEVQDGKLSAQPLDDVLPSSWSAHFKSFIQSKAVIMSEAENIREIYGRLIYLNSCDPFNKSLHSALQTVEKFRQQFCLDLMGQSKEETVPEQCPVSECNGDNFMY